jgi:hypothetical protein
MLIKQMALLFFLASCGSLFKGPDSLKNQDPEKLLSAVRLTGEGKGRLTLGQSQYVFSVDSVLKENFDWILAVTIPLHGEEVMILPNLKESQVPDDEIESFEERIETEFRRLKLNKKMTSKQFLSELRSLIRFNLSPAWGQKRDCKAQQNDVICDYDGEKFVLNVTEKEFRITKLRSGEKGLQLIAKNLTESFFQKTDIRLDTFSLELFW